MVRIFAIGATLLSVLLGSTSAAILQGTTTLDMNRAIRFDSAKVFTAPAGSIITSQYPCSLSVNAGDLHFVSHDCGTCTWYCPCEIIGSVRPFYAAKKPTEVLSTFRSINLNDTAAFKKVDSSKTGATCYLPALASLGFSSLASGRINWSFPLVVLTAQKKYVLVKLDSLLTRSYDPFYPQFGGYYTRAVILHWFLQTDGTTNFFGITSADKNLIPRGLSSRHRLQQDQVFDILGRKVHVADSKDANIFGASRVRLLCSKKDNTATLVIVHK
jgi:hypothetical protein